MDSKLLICIFLPIIVVVVVSSVVSVVKLLWSQAGLGEERVERNRRATVTVIILSALFCFFNIMYVTLCVNDIYIHVNGLGNSPVLDFLSKLGFFIAIPLNSALKPGVYFARKQHMRDYVMQLSVVRRSVRWGSRKTTAKRTLEVGVDTPAWG